MKAKNQEIEKLVERICGLDEQLTLELHNAIFDLDRHLMKAKLHCTKEEFKEFVLKNLDVIQEVLFRGKKKDSISRIPFEQFQTLAGSECHYVTWSMVEEWHSKEEVEKFKHFMAGQTISSNEKGETAIFAHDYERWLEEGRKDSQGPNWD